MAMKIKLRRVGSIYIIDVVGEMDMYHAFRLKEVINQMVGKNIRDFIINLEEVHYIDSSGIGALLFAHSALKKKGRNLRMTGVKGTVKKVIELTKLYDYFQIKPGLKEAVRDLQGPDQAAAGEGTAGG